MVVNYHQNCRHLLLFIFKIRTTLVVSGLGIRRRGLDSREAHGITVRHIWRHGQDGDIVFLDLLIPLYGIICLGIIRLSCLIV